MSLAEVSVTETTDIYGIKVEEFEMEPELVFSEQRLWAAVALQLIDDYEACLRKIHAIWFEKRVKVISAYLSTLRQLRREANGTWMRLVLEHINVHGDHLIAKLNALDKQYQLSEVQFTIYEDENAKLRKNLHIAR